MAGHKRAPSAKPLDGSSGVVLPTTLAGLSRGDLVSVRPAEVRLGPERIEWWSDVFAWQRGAPASDCLFNFVALADATDPEAFLDFAQIHGVLGLTEDAVPAAFQERDCPRVADDRKWRYERIADWRAYARNARLLMVLANEIKRGRWIDPAAVLGISEAEWAARLQRSGRYVAPTAHGRALQLLEATSLLVSLRDAPDVQEQRRLVADSLELAWLDRATIVPAIDWGIHHWDIERSSYRSQGPRHNDRVARLSLKSWTSVGPDGPWPANMLFDALTAELVSVVCSDRWVTQCHRCGRPYEPRRIRTDQPNYCFSCRPEVRRATNRASARKRYERQKAERQQRLTPKLTP